MDVLAVVPDTYATKSQAAHCVTSPANEQEQASAAAPQCSSLPALLGYIPHALSCLWERVALGEGGKGGMGNCRLCPTWTRPPWLGKPWGTRFAVSGQGWQEEAHRADHSARRAGWQPPSQKMEAMLATSYHTLLLLLPCVVCPPPSSSPSRWRIPHPCTGPFLLSGPSALPPEAQHGPAPPCSPHSPQTEVCPSLAGHHAALPAEENSKTLYGAKSRLDGRAGGWYARAGGFCRKSCRAKPSPAETLSGRHSNSRGEKK